MAIVCVMTIRQISEREKHSENNKTKRAEVLDQANRRPTCGFFCVGWCSEVTRSRTNADDLKDGR